MVNDHLWVKEHKSAHQLTMRSFGQVAKFFIGPFPSFDIRILECCERETTVNVTLFDDILGQKLLMSRKRRCIFCPTIHSYL